MQYFKSSIVVAAISLAITLTTGVALSQSGRGRPRVAPPQPLPGTKPEPIKIPANTAVTKQEQITTTSRFVLRNGITVIISEQHAIPLVAAVAFLKTGAPDEPEAGFERRLMARMLFRGTTHRPGDTAIAELRSLGVVAQTNTARDGTAFTLLVPPEKIKEALAVQADMIQSPALDADVMRREMQPALEEGMNGSALAESALTPSAIAHRRFESEAFALTRPSGLDDPAAYAGARLLSLALPTGNASNLDLLGALSRDQLVEFHRTHYTPQRLIISVAGDVSTFETLVAIQQAYGDFGVKPEAEAAAEKPTPPANIPVRANAKQPPSTAVENRHAAGAEEAAADPKVDQQPAPVTREPIRYLAERADISQSIVSAGFRVPGAESEDAPAVEMLAAVLGRGSASRLSRSLIDVDLAANRIRVDYVSLPREGLLRFQMWVATDSREGASLDKAEAALFKALARLRSEPPSQAEIARARTVLEKRFVDQTGTYLGRAMALAHAEAVGQGLGAILDHSSWLARVRPEDIQRVAAEILNLSNVTVYEYEPLSAPARTFDSETFATTVRAWAPGFDAGASNAPGRETKPKTASAAGSQNVDRGSGQHASLESVQPLPVRDFSTLNGPKAFVREDHSQPNVTIALLFQGGTLTEDTATSGTTELMLRSILYGTPRRSFSQMTDEFDELGADVRVVVEPDFCGFLLSVLSRNAERAVKLLRDVIEEPAFRDEDIARARLAQIEAIRSSRDSAIGRSRELLFQALFPGHSYSLPTHGREEVVNKLTSEKLNEWHARVVKRTLPVAVIVGDTAGSALVSSQLAEGFKRRDPETSLQVRTPRPEAPVEKSESRGRGFTAIAVGFPGPKADSADRVALKVIEAAFNGEGGRVLQAEHNRPTVLAASLSDDLMFAAGAISVAALIQPGSAQQARASLVAEMGRIGRSGLDADEAAAARAMAITMDRALLQSQAEHALRYARSFFYIKNAAEADAFAEQASKVTAEDIKRVASVYFKSQAASSGLVQGAPARNITQAPSKQD